MDLMMPDCDGISALKLIRERWSQIELPVIMVTARSDASDVIESLREGANDYITKPVDFEMTQIRIKNHLSLSRNSKLANTLLNGIPVGVVIVDPETRIIESVNQHAEKMFGGCASSLIGKRCHALLCPAEEHACPVCDLGKEIDNTERVMLRDNAPPLPVLKTVKVMTVNGQRKLLECFVDISDKKKAEQDKVQMQHQVNHSQRLASIGELAAGVGHEINNPLAIICGFMDILELELQDNAGAAKPIAAIKKASGRIRNIVNGLRTFARADTDHVAAIDMHKAISDTVDLVESIYSKEGVKIQRNFLASNANVVGNMGKVQQVIMNLLSNAKDAITPNTGTITLETSIVDNNSMLLIRCADTGGGIAKENLQKIFDSFFTTKELGKGTGLGLSICHSIVESMKGKLGVESTLGTGTQFSILVPLASHAAAEVPVAAVKARSNSARFSGKEVLIVDDEEHIRDVLRVMLERIGFCVDDACNGEVALHMIANNTYDLVITDLTMPLMTGEELLTRLRSAANSIPVIVATGGIVSEFAPERREALRKMANGYLNKPFGSEELVTTLAEVLPKSTAS
jgi:signal transduction histidine kinase/DNA-binding response OmpR family regulator